MSGSPSQSTAPPAPSVKAAGKQRSVSPSGSAGSKPSSTSVAPSSVSAGSSRRSAPSDDELRQLDKQGPASAATAAVSMPDAVAPTTRAPMFTHIGGRRVVTQPPPVPQAVPPPAPPVAHWQRQPYHMMPAYPTYPPGYQVYPQPAYYYDPMAVPWASPYPWAVPMGTALPVPMGPYPVAPNAAFRRVNATTYDTDDDSPNRGTTTVAPPPPPQRNLPSYSSAVTGRPAVPSSSAAQALSSLGEGLYVSPSVLRRRDDDEPPLVPTYSTVVAAPPPAVSVPAFLSKPTPLPKARSAPPTQAAAPTAPTTKAGSGSKAKKVRDDDDDDDSSSSISSTSSTKANIGVDCVHITGVVFPVVTPIGTPYGPGLPTADVIVPEGHPRVRLNRIFYDAERRFPYTVGKRRNRPPDMKLGGICGDVSDAVMVNLIAFLAYVRVEAIDMFKPRMGRCAIWLQDPANDFKAIHGVMHHKVWMAPVDQAAALVVTEPDSFQYLVDFLQRLRSLGPSMAHFPRHTITVERWEP